MQLSVSSPPPPTTLPPALRRLAGKRMRKLLRHEIKSNLQLATSERLAYLSLQTAGRAVVGAAAAAAVAILHIQVLVKCSAAKAPTDIQQMHVRNKENSSLFQARRLSNRAMSMSMSMRGLPIPRCVCVCVCIERALVQCPRNGEPRTERGKRAAATDDRATFSSFFFYFRWPRLINEHREKCDQM